MGRLGGSWAKSSTLYFSSGHDLMVCECEPCVRLCVGNREPAWDSLSPSLSLSVPPLLMFSLSLSLSLSSQNKYTNFKKKKKSVRMRRNPTLKHERLFLTSQNPPVCGGRPRIRQSRECVNTVSETLVKTPPSTLHAIPPQLRKRKGPYHSPYLIFHRHCDSHVGYVSPHTSAYRWLYNKPDWANQHLLLMFKIAQQIIYSGNQ